MNAPHTPGPWLVSISSSGNIVKGVSTFGRIIAGDIIIAECEKPYPYGAGFNTEANARLIASAPELLAALETCVNHVLHYGSMPHAHPQAFKDAADARAIIKKSIGKTL